MKNLFNPILILLGASFNGKKERFKLTLILPFWKDKARIKWNTFWDRNTKFFHRYAQIKNKTKLISSLKINNDAVTSKFLMEAHISDHFNILFNQHSLRNESDAYADIWIICFFVWFCMFLWAIALNIAPMCAMVYTSNSHVLLLLCSIILLPLMNVCLVCHILDKKEE